jgi:uncharacterized SAM-binding protein YcdF (DUF218 family)
MPGASLCSFLSRLSASSRGIRLRRTILPALIGLATMVALALVDPPHRSSSRPIRAEAAIVLSGDVDYLRIGAASSLLTDGEVSWLLLTGKGAGGDSSQVLREVALARQVSSDRILLEGESESTWENLAFAAPFIRARGWKRVALVTSSSHMCRAELVARRILPEVTWVPVPVVDAGPRSRIIKSRLQEWTKLAWYAARGRL